jgi:hypothetical protein
MSYFAEHGVLRALPFHSCCSFDWSVDLDAGVSTAPLGVNQYVFIGVGQEVLALDGATGARVWAHDLGAPIPPPTDGGDWSPLTAMAVGHGLLVVPAGHTLTAFTLSRDP